MNIFGKDEEEPQTEDTKVILSTIHSAKGLEWKHVFIIGMNDQNFPGIKKYDNQNPSKHEVYLNKKRKELFVALTQHHTHRRRLWHAGQRIAGKHYRLPGRTAAAWPPGRCHQPRSRTKRTNPGMAYRNRYRQRQYSPICDKSVVFVCFHCTDFLCRIFSSFCRTIFQRDCFSKVGV